MATEVGRTEPPLIVIVGPTASGKSAVAIKLAHQLNGEIICADSRTIYRHMDIGTAKPTQEEQAMVPHWGLDLVDPDQGFTVADFKRYVDTKIADIRMRGRIPLLVGGSGLYVDAVIFDFTLGDEVDLKQRAYLEVLSLSELHKYCVKNNIKLPENHQNKRYVIRAIERKNQILKRRELPISSSIIVGIATEKDALRQRIVERSEQIFTNGIVAEATILGQKYGWHHESMTGNVYPLIHSYIDSDITIQEAKAKFIALDQKLSKRQMTWFRRNPYIMWVSREDVFSYVKARLAAI